MQSSSEKDFENALRPLSFNDFSGQQQVVENLEVFVEAAKYRGNGVGIDAFGKKIARHLAFTAENVNAGEDMQSDRES